MNKIRIAYCSDLHLEFEIDSRKKIVNGLLTNGIRNDCDANVLVLAGDVVPASCILSGQCDTFFDNTSCEFGSIVYVFGNHEYYEGYFYEDVEKVKSYLKRWQNMHLLEKNSIEICGILFYGATLWTNMDNENPLVMLNAKRMMNDYTTIRKYITDGHTITAEDTLSSHKQAMQNLNEFLEQGNPCVIVTHHAPSFQSIHDKYRGRKAMNSSYYYFSDLDYIMMNNDHIRFWIHGHVHDKFDYEINKTKVLCNPRGYINHEPIADHFTLAYIDMVTNH